MEKSGNDSRKVFGVVKELIQGSSTRYDVINSKEGETLTESDDIKSKWVEYCSDFTRKKT